MKIRPGCFFVLAARAIAILIILFLIYVAWCYICWMLDGGDH